MRFRTLLALILLAAVGLPSTPPVRAQGPAMEFLMEQMRQRDADRRRQQQQPPTQQRRREREGQTRWRFERPERARPERAERPRRIERVDRGERVERPRRPRVAPEVSDRSPQVVEVPRAASARPILVIGDEMAEGLAQGLREAFAQDSQVRIVTVVRNGSGLAPREPADLVALAREAAGGEAPLAAVILIGMNDRRAITENGRPVEFRSARWRELYTARAQALVQAFSERRIPVYWTGLPAMRQRQDATDAAFINDIVKAVAFAAGVKHVDTWEGFVDAEGRFLQIGPDMNGNPRRLRQADGIALTAAGNRNLAFFVETELRADLPIGGAAVAAVTPTEQVPFGPPREPPREVPRSFVGPVLPLQPPPTPARAELGGAPRRSAPPDDLATRVLIRGEAPPRHAGRVDDFRWPREEQIVSPTETPPAAVAAGRAPVQR